MSALSIPRSEVTAPRFAALWAAFVYAAITLVLGHSALAGMFLVNPVSDEYIAGYAFREFGASTLRDTGEFPLWNPYLYGGLPFVAGMHGDIFYIPVVLLRMVLPTDVAMTWTFLIHIFLAGMFTYGFLRAAGLGFWGALVGGIAYMLSGQIASLVSPGHDGKLYVSALLPLALWFLIRGVRDGRRWAWGAIALTVGLAVLSPHPQLLQYMLLTGGAFALFLAFGGLSDDPPPRPVLFRRLAYGLGAVGLGFLIGAIQYVPVFEYVNWSPRAGGAGWEHAISYSMPPEELLNTYLPQFTGILENYWGRNAIHFHSEYLGVAAMVLAGLAFGTRDPRRRSFMWFFTGVGIVALLWALGGFTPFYRLVYVIVPGTKFFRAPSTIFYVVSFAVAVLAAVGAERALAREVGPRYVIGWGAVAVVIALLATAGGLTNLAEAIVPERTFDLVEMNERAVILGAWRSFLFVMLTLGILVAAGRARLRPAVVAGLLAAVVAVDLWSVVKRYWMFMPPAEVIYGADATIEYVKGLDQPARVLALQLEPSAAPNDPFLRGDALMVHRIPTTLGYHGNELGRYQDLYQKNGDMVRHILTNANFWALTNTRFLLTNLDVAAAGLPGFTRVAGPVQNAAGSMVSLYDLPGEQPLAWVTPAIVELPEEQVLPTVLDPRFDVRRVALFDTSANVVGEQLQALPEPLPLTIRATSYAPGEITLELSAPAPQGSALVVAENYYPGWRATVDGRPVEVGRADYTLIGVPLPEGARRVELTFQSDPYETGKAITVVALVATALLIFGGIILERRAHAAAPATRTTEARGQEPNAAAAAPRHRA